ncbi:hypothetical protein Hrd1104_02145 [Halorhabdus sp. CBA1104]|uniref:hypothetical protein n=1 Tax=Halorhabdus sp. CBA1104 TaxID=1380432 RepID=UPI0012B1972D|nr:hypothetical protein [Halorhabdus sp. CBA1104]QGN06209.1 hypothetical protein Hrd1104_02145 [Halorhabdus sp. CBA1104]
MPTSGGDRRAVGFATAVAGAIAFGHVATSSSEITTATSNTLVVAVGIAAVPAGVVVGLSSREYDRHLIEGGFAAICGTAAGILAWAVLKAAMLDGLSLAQRADVVFLVVAVNSPIFVATIPFLFLVGGYTAAKVGEWRSRSIDGDLTVGLFRNDG